MESATEKRLPWSYFKAREKVKRCGKSAPGCWQQESHRQTPSGARPNRGRETVRLVTIPGLVA